MSQKLNQIWEWSVRLMAFSYPMMVAGGFRLIISKKAMFGSMSGSQIYMLLIITTSAIATFAWMSIGRIIYVSTHKRSEQSFTIDDAAQLLVENYRPFGRNKRYIFIGLIAALTIEVLHQFGIFAN